MLRTSTPFSASSFPQIPLRSHDGEKEQNTALFTPFSRQISSTFSAPARNSAVLSGPVTWGRRALSSQVSKMRPFRRFTGGRGHGRPPSISGHTLMTSTSPRLSIMRRAAGEVEVLPCHRHFSPKRQELTTIFSIQGNLNRGEDMASSAR